MHDPLRDCMFDPRSCLSFQAYYGLLVQLIAVIICDYSLHLADVLVCGSWSYISLSTSLYIHSHVEALVAMKIASE